MIFNKFCHIFGLPNEGVHQTRFLGMALFDLIGTLLFAVLLKMFLDRFKETNILIIFLIVFAIGQVSHFLFGVNTAFMNFIGFNFPKCEKKI